MLARKFRLQKKEVERVYKKGRVLRFDNFLIRILDNRTTHARFAVIIPKKTLAKAVDRNRARREIYDILASLDSWRDKNMDLTILFRKYDTSGFLTAMEQIFKAKQ